MRAMVLLLAAFALAGCCSTSVSTSGDKDVLLVSNEGWWLFGCLPVAAGDPERPNLNSPLWFTDSQTLEVNVMMLDNEIRKRGYRDFRDLVSYRTEEAIIPFLFKREILVSSAEVMK